MINLDQFIFLFFYSSSVRWWISFSFLRLNILIWMQLNNSINELLISCSQLEHHNSIGLVWILSIKLFSLSFSNQIRPWFESRSIRLNQENGTKLSATIERKKNQILLIFAGILFEFHPIRHPSQLDFNFGWEILDHKSFVRFARSFDIFFFLLLYKDRKNAFEPITVVDFLDYLRSTAKVKYLRNQNLFITFRSQIS